MSIARILWLVGLLAALIFAFVGSDQFAHGAAIIAILGLMAGWFTSDEHRMGLILAAIFLMAGGSSALGAIPGAGAHLNAILGSIGGLLSAASVMAVLRRIVERVLLGKTGNTAG